MRKLQIKRSFNRKTFEPYVTFYYEGDSITGKIPCEFVQHLKRVVDSKSWPEVFEEVMRTDYMSSSFEAPLTWEEYINAEVIEEDE